MTTTIRYARPYLGALKVALFDAGILYQVKGGTITAAASEAVVRKAIQSRVSSEGWLITSKQ